MTGAVRRPVPRIRNDADGTASTEWWGADLQAPSERIHGRPHLVGDGWVHDGHQGRRPRSASVNPRPSRSVEPSAANYRGPTAVT